MPEEDEVELVCVAVGALLVVRYKMDRFGVDARVSLAWADVWGVLDEWLESEGTVVGTVDEVVPD